MSLPTDLLARHRETLDRARSATRTREFFSAFPESPSPRVYGEDAQPAGKAAFDRTRGERFPVQTAGAAGEVATERSPYGIELGVRYPHLRADGVEELVRTAWAAAPAWRDLGPDGRAGVVLEVLARLHARVFELAHAVMHTSGQAFVMAFQAGGTHALDRALEATAYAYDEMTRHSAEVSWEKPARKEPLRMAKTFTVAPRGVALVIGCNTFPTWNSWPGLFASLACGNPVVVKPHPRAVLPLAITVQVCREVLAECGLSPDLVSLAAEETGEGLAKPLATHPRVRVIDFTGSSEFGTWLERNAHQAVVFAEKSGVNSVVVDSTDSLRGMVTNLAFSLSLYSGQMCTTPQNVFVPESGVDTEEGHRSAEDIEAALVSAVRSMVGEESRAVELLGGIVNDAVLERVSGVPELGEVLLESHPVAHPSFPDAVVRTPALVQVPAEATDTYAREYFGPVSFVVRTSSTEQSLDLLRRTAAEYGAMTASVYSTSDQVLARAREVALEVGVALSENLTDGIYVNQSAAFSDFHGTGANPAANATFTDGAFVAPRFRVVQSRRHA